MNVVLSSRVIDRGRIDTLSTVDDESTKVFLTIYRAAFDPLDLLSPARQGLTDDEFVAQMVSESVLKVVGYDTGGDPVALTFMSADLTTVPWISPTYFAARFPEQAARSALFYFGGLLVRPAQRAGPWAVLLLEEAYRHVIAAGGVAIFDCSRGQRRKEASGTAGQDRAAHLRAGDRRAPTSALLRLHHQGLPVTGLHGDPPWRQSSRRPLHANCSLRMSAPQCRPRVWVSSSRMRCDPKYSSNTPRTTS